MRAALIIALVAAVAHPALAQQAVTVNMIEFSFQPREQVVMVGGTVRWVNQDNAPHQVGMEGAKPGSSGVIAPGKEHSFTFRETGTFTYRCGVHPTMLGEIIVR